MLADRLVELLCEERGLCASELAKCDGFRLFRALVNTRPPMPNERGYARDASAARK